MYETIYRDTIAKNSTGTATVSVGHVNGVFINTKVIDSDTAWSSGIDGRTLTARLRTKKGTLTICQDIPLGLFKNLDATRSSGSMNIDYIYQEYITMLASAVVNSGVDMPNDNWPELLFKRNRQPVNYLEGGVFIDFGSIFLNQGDELSISLRQDNNSEASEVTMMTYSTERSPHHCLTYEYRQDDQVVIYDAMAVFGYYPDKGVMDAKSRFVFSENPDVQVRYRDSSFISSVVDLYSAESARTCGKKNIADAFFLLWENTGMQGMGIIPETVDVRTTGEGAEDLMIFSVSKVFIREKTSEANVNELEELRTRLEKLERQDPEKAKALRHAGDIPKAAEVAAAVSVMETGQEGDK